MAKTLLIQYGPAFSPEEVGELESELERRGVPARIEPAGGRVGVWDEMAGLAINVLGNYTTSALTAAFLVVLTAARKLRDRRGAGPDAEHAVTLNLPANSIFILTGALDDARLISLADYLEDLDPDADYTWSSRTGRLVRDP